METSTQPVSPLRQRMLEDMRMRKFAPKTQQSYIRVVSRFAKYLSRSPDTASAEDLRLYRPHQWSIQFALVNTSRLVSDSRNRWSTRPE